MKSTSEKTCVILATGPSIRDFDLSKIEADVVIGVNDAITFYKPDIWFTLDVSPVNEVIMENPVDGVYYICAPTRDKIERVPNHVEKLNLIVRGDYPNDEELYGYSLEPSVLESPEWWFWKWRCMPGLAEAEIAVHSGNSPYGALNLAYTMGFGKIVLLGVDGTQEDKVVGGAPRELFHLPLLFSSATGQLLKRGTKVVLGSPKSRVKCFYRMQPEAALEWLND